jgi:thioredoxin 1
MKVELLHTPGCGRCANAAAELKSAAGHVPGEALDWRELDITKHIDYAVQLGVLSPPALAIDEELAFVGVPSRSALVHEIKRRLGRAEVLDDA